MYAVFELYINISLPFAHLAPENFGLDDLKSQFNMRRGALVVYSINYQFMIDW